MRKTVVIDVVGLTADLLGEHTPHLSAWAGQANVAEVEDVTPAVTCSVQSTYLTGRHPSGHGVVGNGWYSREDAEVRFWRQSNQLVQGPKVWDLARERDPAFTCANVCWWFNMYSGVDYALTPRPMYPADGRKLPDVHSKPAALRAEVQADLGTFPLFKFWGPTTSIYASQWIAQAAEWLDRRHDPTLTLIYLPHLDYCLQRVGPHRHLVAEDLRQIDALCGELIDFYEDRGAQVVLVSEYGMSPVSRPVHLNRVLREHDGLLTVREEVGRELLDAGASDAFAVADHQIAHVYVRDPDRRAAVRALLEATPGVAEVLDAEGKRAHHLDHERSGDLVALADPDAWFTYYYWQDDERAPDFARTVDIHRKPGYDPVELFVDPALRVPALKVAGKLLRKQLGFRYLMDVIPLDASLVRGSHGRALGPGRRPLLMSRHPSVAQGGQIEPTEVRDLLLGHLFGENGGRRP